MAVENYTTKKCVVCGELKEISNFAKAKTGRYGVRGKCKECNKKHTLKLNLIRSKEIRPKEKKCTKCGNLLSCDELSFKKNISGKYGLSAECRKCLSKRNCELSKLPKYKESRNKWRSNNIEKVRESARKTQQRNKDKYYLYQKEWAELNKAKKSETSKKWYENNKHSLKEKRKVWRRLNQIKCRTYTLNYRAKKNCAGSHSKNDILLLLSLQDNKCAICKIKLHKFDVDHITPISKGGSNNKENLQILCPKCNKEKSDKDPLLFMQEKGYLI